MSCRACCISNLAIPSDYNPLQTFSVTDKFLFVADCLPGSPCANALYPGFSGGTVFPNTPSVPAAAEICNAAETAQGFVGGILCATVTVPSGTYCDRVPLNVPNFALVLANRQASLNATALAQAQAQANAAALLNCAFCNVQKTATAICPSNIALTAMATVAAGSICAPTTQADVDGRATVLAANIAESILFYEGCNCYMLTNSDTGISNSTCALNIQTNFWPSPILVNGAMDWGAEYFALNGSHPHNALLSFVEVNGQVPPFSIYFP